MTNSPSESSLNELAAAFTSLYNSSRYISRADFIKISPWRKSTLSRLGWFIARPTAFLKERSVRKTVQRLGSETTRQEHNKEVIKGAQRKGFEIEGKPLDAQQIEAVVVTEDAQLVMAAAGSGKTLSLLGKCAYLINELHIRPEKILTISFTKASADELAERLRHLGISVDGKTFHALGLSVLGTDKYRTVTQLQQKDIIETIIQEKIQSDTVFARHFNTFILNYLSMPTPLNDLHTLEQLVQYNRSLQTYTLKPVSLQKQEYEKDGPTYRGEKVRSKEEQIIANFLYINNIAYEYEKPFPGYANYHPDFTITSYSEPIYLEHQGINRQNKTRPDIDSKKYLEKVRWNQDYHKKGGTRLIETFSYEFQEGTVLKNLEKNLRKQGVEIIRKQEHEITALIHQSYATEVAECTKLIITFMGLLKTSENNLGTIRSKVRRLDSPYQRQRTGLFLSLFETIFELYESTLKATDSIDFSDMIVKAADALPSLPGNLMKYDYILVDEVQDLSGARYRLLKALLDRTAGSKLFAVGDDWQSIFRFAGSDLTLLQDFEQKFDRYTYHSVIEQTHRFNNPLLTASSNFIKRNPAQVQKRPFSNVTLSTNLTVNNTATLDSDMTALDSELQKLIDTEGTDTIAKRTIFLIGRYKRDVKRLLGLQDPRMQFRATDESMSRIIWTDTRTRFELELLFMTMHSSKGLTCDHAFILNANNGSGGIPATREDDPITHLLLAHPDAYPFAEERRLFYVALTRAKRSTTLICTPYNQSPFVDELNITPSNSSRDTPQFRCPHCHSGYLIERRGTYGTFYGCTSFGYGCFYTTKTITTT